MDAREAESLLACGGVVGGYLEAKIQFHTAKVEQTNNDITRLNQQAARLRHFKAQTIERLHVNDGIVIVDTVSDCLAHLESAIQLLEAKNESLKGTIYIARLAQGALDKYGNKIPTIPKND